MIKFVAKSWVFEDTYIGDGTVSIPVEIRVTFYEDKHYSLRIDGAFYEGDCLEEGLYTEEGLEVATIIVQNWLFHNPQENFLK